MAAFVCEQVCTLESYFGVGWHALREESVLRWLHSVYFERLATHTELKPAIPLAVIDRLQLKIRTQQLQQQKAAEAAAATQSQTPQDASNEADTTASTSKRKPSKRKSTAASADSNKRRRVGSKEESASAAASASPGAGASVECLERLACAFRALPVRKQVELTAKGFKSKVGAVIEQLLPLLDPNDR